MRKITLILVLAFFLLFSCNSPDSGSGTPSDKKGGQKTEDIQKGKRKGKKDLPPKKVKIRAVTPGTIIGKTFFNAVIEAQNDVSVTAKTSGEIVKMNFDLGTFVRKGDTLAVIEHDIQKAALENAEISLEKAELNFELQTKIFNRNKELFDQKAVSQENFELSENTLKNAELALNQAKASLETAKVNYANCFMKAPFAGVVVNRPVQLGQYVNIGSPVARVVDTRNLQAIVGLTHVDLLNYKKYQKKDVEIILSDGNVIPGRVKGVAEAPDRNTSLYSMKIVFQSKKDEDTKKRIVFPGMQLKVALLGKEYRRSFKISRNSMRLKKEKYYIFVENNGKAEEKEVELLADISNMRVARLVKDGGGSFRLIITGLDALTDGRKVEIIR